MAESYQPVAVSKSNWSKEEGEVREKWRNRNKKKEANGVVVEEQGEREKGKAEEGVSKAGNEARR